MNKPFFCIFFSLFLITSASFAQAKWSFDDAHSNLQFAVSHLMVTEVEGSVKIKESTLITPTADFSDATVYLVADMNSIDTDNEGRDENLKTADIFDAAKYPDMIFKSASFKKIDGNKYSVTGDLTFHGVTKSQTFEAIALTNIRSYDNKTIVGFKVNGIINRIDYGIATDTPSAMLGNEVNIRVNAIYVME
ncbi:MAG: YceI family protein [Saprospiraceae bacterium]